MVRFDRSCQIFSDLVVVFAFVRTEMVAEARGSIVILAACKSLKNDKIRQDRTRSDKICKSELRHGDITGQIVAGYYTAKSELGSGCLSTSISNVPSIGGTRPGTRITPDAARRTRA
jgi:hypothetical protein